MDARTGPRASELGRLWIVGASLAASTAASGSAAAGAPAHRAGPRGRRRGGARSPLHVMASAHGRPRMARVAL